MHRLRWHFWAPLQIFITGNLPLRRRLFCWIYQQRNPQLKQAQGASALPRTCALSHTCSSQRFRGACSDANITLAIGRQLWKLLAEVPAGISGGASLSVWGGRAEAAEAARVAHPGFSQACWKSRLWQLTRETNGSQKSLPGTLAVSQGELALPQPACHPF